MKTRNEITDSSDALDWAMKWPMDREIMRPLVTDSGDALEWVKYWPQDRGYFIARGVMDEKWAEK